MARYFVNTEAQENGDHEVHRVGCQWMPSPGNREDLGEHASCHSAVAKAKTRYSTADGCATCSPDCHTS